MKRLFLTATAFSIVVLSGAGLAPGSAEPLKPFDGTHSAPFTATLSNNTPLVFGMDEAGAAQALGSALTYVSGRPGNEIYFAVRNIGGSGLLNHNDRLYLQFRKGRLAGWKGDWGHNWMWK